MRTKCESSLRQSLNGCHHSAQFGQCFEPPDGWIAGDGSASNVGKYLVSMVGPERNRSMVACGLTAALFEYEFLHEGNDIHIAGKMRSLIESVFARLLFR